MTWTDVALEALGVMPFIFLFVVMSILEKERKEDHRRALKDARLAREFDEEMRKFYPNWGKR